MQGTHAHAKHIDGDKNYNEWTFEEKEKRDRLRGQRDQMRNELQSQMVKKAEQAKAVAVADRVKHIDQLAAIEKKLLEDEIKNMERTSENGAVRNLKH